jgi:hypothetical protein
VAGGRHSDRLGRLGHGADRDEAVRLIRRRPNTAWLAAPGLALGACAGPARNDRVPPFAARPYEAFARQNVVAIALREWRLFGSLVDDDPPGSRLICVRKAVRALKVPLISESGRSEQKNPASSVEFTKRLNAAGLTVRILMNT